MDYADFELQLGPPISDGFLVRVLQSPAGQGEAILHLPDEESVERDIRIRSRLEISPTGIGGGLFRALMAGAVGELFLQSLSLVGPDRGLRIRLRINPRGEGLEPLHRQPWELIYRESTDDFLALSRRTPVVRALDLARPIPAYPFVPPLRILAVLSQGGEALDLGRELRQLQEVLGRRGGAVLDVLENPGARALRETLDRAPYHVLHYMGHGSFDPATGEGGLLLRGPDGKNELLSGRHLATKTKDVSSLRLVVLNACETALVSGSPAHNPFAGVASALLLAGVPAVVAMQSTVADAHAIAFSAAFYQQLARGTPVDEAVAEGRQAIHSQDPAGRGWAIPVLFLRTPTGELFAGAKPVRRPARTVVRVAGIALSLAALASMPALLERWRPEPREPQTLEGLASTPAPPTPEETPPPKQETKEPAKSSEVVRAAGGGSSGLRVEVAGSRSFPSAFSSAVRQQLSGSFSGWTLRVDAEPPEVQPFSEGSETMQSCRLAATARLEGPGRSIDLGPLSQSRAAFQRSSACDTAASDLAGRVVRQIRPYLGKENPR